MGIHIEKKLSTVGNCKAVYLPKTWAVHVVQVGILIYDLKNKEERKRFFEAKERMIEEQTNGR